VPDIADEAVTVSDALGDAPPEADAHVDTLGVVVSVSLVDAVLEYDGVAESAADPVPVALPQTLAVATADTGTLAKPEVVEDSETVVDGVVLADVEGATVTDTDTAGVADEDAVPEPVALALMLPVAAAEMGTLAKPEDVGDSATVADGSALAEAVSVDESVCE